ncbi:MAG: hypothetical protein EBS96_08505 [Spartobacteria bacterium]|nr:hypothetical protein [Spartobacteria bacterium]
MKEFCSNVRFVSLLGTEPWVDELVGGVLSEKEDATLREESFTTVVKKRYVEPLFAGNELSKLFSINYLNDEPPSEAVQQRLFDSIRREMKSCDVVLLTDFGHGLMQKKLRELVL